MPALIALACIKICDWSVAKRCFFLLLWRFVRKLGRRCAGTCAVDEAKRRIEADLDNEFHGVFEGRGWFRLESRQ